MNICDVCPKPATEYFQTMDNFGNIRHHQMCRDCFEEMLDEEYD